MSQLERGIKNYVDLIFLGLGLDFEKMDSIKIRCQQAVLVQSELNYMSLAAAAAAVK